MTDVPPVAQTAAQGPKKAAKGIAGLVKNKPPVFYVVLVAGILAAAWFIRKREAAQAPTDTTAQDVTTDGAFNPAYGPTDGALAGGYGSGAVDQTGTYMGGPIPIGGGLLWDPSTGIVYGALPDAQQQTELPTPVLNATGGGAPANGGVEAHSTPLPVWTPSATPIPPKPPPIPQGTGPDHVLWTCPPGFPHNGPNPGSCFKDVCLKGPDGHGHGKGKWHVYRDGTWIHVASTC